MAFISNVLFPVTDYNEILAVTSDAHNCHLTSHLNGGIFVRRVRVEVTIDTSGTGLFTRKRENKKLQVR